MSDRTPEEKVLHEEEIVSGIGSSATQEETAAGGGALASQEEAAAGDRIIETQVTAVGDNESLQDEIPSEDEVNDLPPDETTSEDEDNGLPLDEVSSEDEDNDLPPDETISEEEGNDLPLDEVSFEDEGSGLPQEEISSKDEDNDLSQDEYISEDEDNTDPEPEEEDEEEDSVSREAQRNRKLLEKRTAIVSALALFAMVFAGAVFLLVVPRSTVSNVEKRTLAEFPTFSVSSYFSGDFTSDVTEFYDDTVPFRDTFKNIGNNLKTFFGISSGDSAVLVGAASKVDRGDGNSSNESAESAATEVTSSTAVEETETAAAAQTTSEDAGAAVSEHDFTKDEIADATFDDGFLILFQNHHWRGIPLFGGGTGDSYVAFLNELRNELPDSVRIYSMPVPLCSEYYTPANYSDYTASQQECFDTIASELSDGITTVDVVPILAKHTEEDIYLRTDHHWQPLGAYYAAQALAEAADVSFPELSTYTKGENEGYVGSLYGYTENANLLNDPETFTYYKPNGVRTDTDYYDTAFNYSYSGDLFVETDVNNSYLMFMGGDGQIAKVKTGLQTGRTLLVIKDSYGNAEIPFYTSSFDEIYVIDMRYFDRNLVTFINDLGITDVVLTCCSYSVVGSNADSLMNLLTQDAGNHVLDEAPEYSSDGDTASEASTSSAQ